MRSARTCDVYNGEVMQRGRRRVPRMVTLDEWKAAMSGKPATGVATMAPAADTSEPKRTVKRLTAQEKRDKARASVRDNVTKASTLLINVADGYMASGDRERAKRTLDIWTMVADLEASST